jgi:GNAT superfamily N-acetyltransferase
MNNSEIEIIDYKPEHHSLYRKLNRDWIEKYFEIEEADLRALDEPEKYILGKGGFIFMAKYKDEIVGTCSLIKIDDSTFELAKMAVIDKAKGKGIGFLLGKHCIKTAQQAGARKVELLSNTILVPAISLYKKLGFKEVELPVTDYKRANIKMELDFEDDYKS